MGNSQPKWFEAFKKEYKQEPTKETHPYLGEINVYQHNTIESIQVMSKLVTLPQKLESEDKEDFQKRIKIKHNNVFEIYHCEYTEKSQSCTEKPILYLTVYAEYPGTKTLQSVTTARGAYWDEPYIWGFVKQIIDGGAELERKKIIHGDIRPEYLMIKSNQIKLMETGVYFQIRNAYESAFQRDLHFLSPEQLDLLSAKNNDPKQKKISVKSDIYSLGMSLLQLTLMREPLDCYQEGTVSEDIIHGFYTEIMTRYSPCLISLIQQLLAIAPGDRPTFIELQKQLEPFQDSIRDGTPFYNGIVFCACNDGHHFDDGIHVSPVKEAQLMSVQEAQLMQTPMFAQPQMIMNQSPVRSIPVQAVQGFNQSPVQSVPMQMSNIAPQMSTYQMSTPQKETNIFFGEFPESKIQ